MTLKFRFVKYFRVDIELEERSSKHWIFILFLELTYVFSFLSISVILAPDNDGILSYLFYFSTLSFRNLKNLLSFFIQKTQFPDFSDGEKKLKKQKRKSAPDRNSIVSILTSPPGDFERDSWRKIESLRVFRRYYSEFLLDQKGSM